MSIFESPEKTHEALRSVGYLTTPLNSTIIYYSSRMNLPMILEGPAGAGKTQLAVSVAQAEGLRLVRLQCYSGITDKQAIGDYNQALRDLYTTIQSKGSSLDWASSRAILAGREFFLAGPLLEALESDKRVVLLIDELDKVDYAFEAQLLEILSVWEISVPTLGTIPAKIAPFTVVTSNHERDLGFAMLRRCTCLEIGHPNAKLEAEIVARKTPELPKALHQLIAGIAKSLRSIRMQKPPSISEMVNIAQALHLLGKTTIEAQDVELLLPLFAKTESDRKYLMSKDRFRLVISLAHKEVAKMQKAERADAVTIAKVAAEDESKSAKEWEEARRWLASQDKVTAPAVTVNRGLVA
jgi:MoxR-like ATPase